MKGHIEIRDKVRFVYYELEKPNRNDYNKSVRSFLRYRKAYEKYEVSKQEVEIENVFQRKYSKEWIYRRKMKGTWADGPEHNQPCEAEVNGKAVITKIL